MVPIAEDADGARLPKEHVIMLNLERVTMEFPRPEIDGENIRMVRRRYSTQPQNPVVPVQFGRGTPGVTARVSGEIPRRMGHESHVEKRLSRIPGDVVPVKNIKRAVVAGRQDESATGHCGSELHRVGCLQHPLAAQPDRLPKEQARSVKLRRLRSGLLKLEVLNGAPESANLREPSLRNHLRDE